MGRDRRYSTGDIKPLERGSHVSPRRSDKTPVTIGNINNSNNNNNGSNRSPATTPRVSSSRVAPTTARVVPTSARRRSASVLNTPPSSKKKKQSVYPYKLSKEQEARETELLKARAKAMRKTPGPDPRELRTRFPRRSVSQDIDKMSIITNNIVLGSKRDAANKSKMERLGITHILNMAQQVQNHHSGDFIYHKIDILDSPDTDITESYADSSSFMSRVEQVKGRVLVHCVSGVSRSVSVVIMHFVGKYRMHLKNAYNHIYAARPYIHPNNGFKYQLALFELGQLGTSSIADSTAGKAWSFYEWNSVKSQYRKQSVDGSEGLQRDFYTVCCTIS